ncbi:NADP-dependent oxidoreductase [Microbacterium sp. NPDC055903]
MTENTMHAISQRGPGGPEVLELIETDRPRPGGNEVLVAVHAAGLNPTDWKHRAGAQPTGERPYILGWDVSGVVAEVGPGVTLLQPGDEVFGMLPYPAGHGSHAEFVTSPSRALVRKPATLSHVEAAAVPLAALTAWQALVDTADVQPGQRVLIHAAAGGVGHFAVQIAKARGAHVIGTASAGKHEILRSLGADEVIDYRTQDVATSVRDVDVALVPFVGEERLRTLDTLRPGGVLVTILPAQLGELTARAAELGVRATGMLVEHDQAGMRAIAQLVDDGLLRPLVERTFPLADAAEAHALGEQGRVTGKLVLSVRD